MLNNKADEIEDYILRMLAKNRSGQIELKRTDLADEVSCAPSQISYVLSTRFTNAKGFQVESRRGLGGYIRITILDNITSEKQFIYKAVANALNKDTEIEELQDILDLLVRKKMITAREAELALQMITVAYALESEGAIPTDFKLWLIHNIFNTLSS